MATRSTISIQNKNGSIDSIYCHWDGYPSHNGKLLLEHYSDEEKIRELISLGDLSSLNEKLNPSKGSKHTFDNPENGVTIAYHRDRGEELEINKLSSMSEYNKESNREEWNYLWKDGAWHYAYMNNRNFNKLTSEVCKE